MERIFKFKDKKFRKYFSYFGHYSDIYQLYGFKYFLSKAPYAIIPPQGRGTLALCISKWLDENIPDHRI